jgi:hypothetical protein
MFLSHREALIDAPGLIESFAAEWNQGNVCQNFEKLCGNRFCLMLLLQAKCYVISELSDIGHENGSAKGSSRIGFLTLSFHLKKETEQLLIKLQ